MKIPEGWPTRAMIDAADDPFSTISRSDARAIVMRALAAAPTPPAQEDEPIYQYQASASGYMWIDIDKNQFDYYSLHKFNTRILYTRPGNSELHKAVEEVCKYDRNIVYLEPLFKALENLRAALEEKPCGS